MNYNVGEEDNQKIKRFPRIYAQMPGTIQKIGSAEKIKSLNLGLLEFEKPTASSVFAFSKITYLKSALRDTVAAGHVLLRFISIQVAVEVTWEEECFKWEIPAGSDTPEAN